MARMGIIVLLSKIIPDYNSIGKSILIGKRFNYIHVCWNHDNNYDPRYIAHDQVYVNYINYLSVMIDHHNQHIHHTLWIGADSINIRYKHNCINVWGEVNGKWYDYTITDDNISGTWTNPEVLLSLHRYNIMEYMRKHLT